MSATASHRHDTGCSEYLSDVAVHLAGIVAVAAAVPVLIVLAALSGHGAWDVTATSVYGACLIAMICSSALYNIFPQAKWEWLLRRLDHSAIYLKIAGTHTAFALIAGQGLALAGAIWAAALAGIVLKLVAPFRWRWVSLCLYLGMGWAAAVLGRDVFAALPATVPVLVAAGGLVYTAGVGVYLCEGLRFRMAIWHSFVLVASLSVYAGLVVAVRA